MLATLPLVMYTEDQAKKPRPHLTIRLTLANVCLNCAMIGVQDAQGLRSVYRLAVPEALVSNRSANQFSNLYSESSSRGLAPVGVAAKVGGAVGSRIGCWIEMFTTRSPL
jgi:hypothetical protein